MLESPQSILGRPVNSEARAQKRAQILAGARRCFLRDGFHKATIANIGQEAKVNVASIYQYYKNKDALVEALVEEMASQEMALLKSFDPDRLNFASLREFAETIFVGEAGREASTLRSEILSEAARNPMISEYVVSARTKVIQAMTEFVKRFQQRGDIPSDLDPDSAAADLAYFHEGIQAHIPMRPDKRPELLEIHVRFIAARLCISALKG